MAKGRDAGGEMTRNMSDKKGVTFLSIVLGLLFIGASLYKIKSPATFAHEIFNYRILPPWAINPQAIVLPWLQFFCGLALLTGRLKKGAAFLLTSMMMVFQIAVASVLIRGLNISCGCFKSGGDPATWLNFGRDSLIFAACICILVTSFRRCSSSRQFSGRDPI